jgi:thioredoxin reductase (NADPH)
MSVLFDVVILGAGPAGLSAGLHTAQLGRKVLLLDRGQIGGHLLETEAVTDYPGFTEEIGGAELGMKMYEQAAQAGLQTSFGEVTSVEMGGLEYRIEASGEIFQGRSLIICTGTSPKKLGVPGEEQLYGSGISYCVVCDAPLHKGMDVAVVGSGDMAVEDALYLSKFAKRVTLFAEKEELQANQRLREQISKRVNIEVILEHSVESLSKDDRGIRVRLKKARSGEEFEALKGGVFVSLGRIPNTQFLEGKLPLNESKQIITNDALQAKAPHIWAAGRVRAGSISSTASDVGEGARAAIMADRYLAGP